MALQASDEKYLLYDSQSAQAQKHSTLQEGNPLWFWNDRLILVEHKISGDDGCWHFTALDLITNETRPLYFFKSGNQFLQVNVISLNKDYGFVIESVGNVFCVNLVKLEWASQKFQLIEKLDQEQEHQFSGILVNNLNLSKFILRFRHDDSYTYQACTLGSKKIELGDVYEEPGVLFEHYFDNKLFVLAGNMEIITYDLTLKREQRSKIEAFLDGLVNVWYIEWVRNRLYASVLLRNTRRHGIVYTDLKSKRWTLLDFTTDLRISKIQYFDGTLLVHAADNTFEADIYDDVHDLVDITSCSTFKVYNIPVQHPQKLRKLVWSLMINMMKEDEKITDPYQAAARYLPFNSDLRPKWSLDKVDLGKPASDKQRQDEQNETKAIEASMNSSQESIEEAVPSKRAKLD